MTNETILTIVSLTVVYAFFIATIATMIYLMFGD